MSALLLPDGNVQGVPAALIPSASQGYTLGDHVRSDDPIDGAQAGACPINVAVPRLLGPSGRHFSPYEMNGGTVLSVSGDDYTIVASDTRYGVGYSIPARYVSRVLKLTDKVVLASGGMLTDIQTLHKVLKIRLAQYKHNHRKDISLSAASQMLSNILYYRRFQPYYAFNVLGGIDEKGEGWSYGYDAIGSHERVRAVCSGTGQALLQPVLDNQVEFRQTAPGARPTKLLDMGPCLELLKDAFSSAGERDIYTGDTVEFFKITKSGVEVERFELKMD